jgi:hypothetical protein
MSPNLLRAARWPLRSLFALACLVGGLFPVASSAQMQIDEVIVTSGPARNAGAFTDYFIDPIVFGSGIDSVLLSSQSGALSNVQMVEVTPGEFACDEEIPTEPCENFTSLAQIPALGDLTFSIMGDLGENDSVTVALADYDPGTGQTGFPDVLFPAHGQSGVSATATLQWSTPPGWVTAIAAGLEELLSGNSTDDAVFLGSPPGSPVTTTSWAPTGMVDGISYDFEVSFLELFELEDPRVSSGGRGYLYSSAFESFNQIVFTVPEPAMLYAFAAGAILLLGLARRRATRMQGDRR